MAHEIKVLNKTFIANSDMSLMQYYAVYILANGNVDIATVGGNAIGIMQDTPALGYAGNVAILGESKAVYGGNVTAGQNLQVDATGRLITAGSGAVVAIAEDSGAVGEIHSVFLLTHTASGANTKGVMSIPVVLPAVTAGMTVASFVPGFVGAITKVQMLVTNPATTALKLFTLSPFINAVAVTGGVLALTSANMAPLGNNVQGTAVTATNAFIATDSIIFKSTAVTAFAEGEGLLIITLG
jgi:hypothetical protein